MTKVKDLKVKDFIAMAEKLKECDPEMDITVDLDIDGHYSVEKISVVVDQYMTGEKVLNIKTSNES